MNTATFKAIDAKTSRLLAGFISKIKLNKSIEIDGDKA